MTLNVGDTYPASVTVAVDGVPTDPASLKFTIRPPEGADVVRSWPTHPEVVRDAAGQFHDDFPVTAEGWWRFQWEPQPDGPVEGDLFHVGPAPIDDLRVWRPSMMQVAALMRSRTRGIASRDATIAGEQGAFTATTRPKYADVQELIDLAFGELDGMLAGRSPCTVPLARAAATALTYRTGQLIEVGYFPEQTAGEDNTAFSSLDKLWASASKAVVAAVMAQCPLNVGDPTPGGPLGRVPLYVPIGWDTRF
jgi:hypothetical protein